MSTTSSRRHVPNAAGPSYVDPPTGSQFSLHFVAANTAHVANAVAQQCPSAIAPPGGPFVEQDAPMTTHKRSASPSIPVNPKNPPILPTMAQQILRYGFGQ